MALRIQVGRYADLRANDPAAAEKLEPDLATISRLVTGEGFQPHQEPAELGTLHYQAPSNAMPYTYLHYLRRFYARRRRDPYVLPTPVGDSDPVEDHVLAAEYHTPQSHLICHSDKEGYYVPIPFTRILVDPYDDLTGGLLGSTQKLFTELEKLAGALRIRYDGDLISRATLQDVRQDFAGRGPYAIERLVWITLYDACRLSLQHRSLISFTE